MQELRAWHIHQKFFFKDFFKNSSRFHFYSLVMYSSESVQCCLSHCFHTNFSSAYRRRFLNLFFFAFLFFLLWLCKAFLNTQPSSIKNGNRHTTPFVQYKAWSQQLFRSSFIPVILRKVFLWEVWAAILQRTTEWAWEKTLLLYWGSGW